VVPGRGQIDYSDYLRGVSDLRRDVPLMMEHLKTPAEYDEGARYIRRVANTAGVTFV
jgi:sugar phosphate isomerase/epimerase